MSRAQTLTKTIYLFNFKKKTDMANGFRRKRAATKIAPNGEAYTSESDIQAACVAMFRAKFPHLAEDLFSIPNGARVGGKIGAGGFPVGARTLKAEGMLSGVADLMLAVPANGFAGLFIEMKTPVGALRPEQREFLKRRAALGYAVEVCRSVDEFDRAICSYLDGTFVQQQVWELRFRKN
jgi:hypothetical protein